MASFHHRVKSGKKGAAADHAAYIGRRGKHQIREDLVYARCGNLPEWAQGDPATFWRAADKYERANGAVYREHEIALPNELSMEQNRDLAETLVEELVGSKPYEVALHAPIGSMSDQENPHLHLMFSDRVPDGIDRPAAKTFARYNAKRPELGGRRKDSGGRTPLELRDELINTRKKIADIQNQALARYGFDARVDHRTLREQGVKRSAERHLGPARVRVMSPEEKSEFTARRQSDGAEQQTST